MIFDRGEAEVVARVNYDADERDADLRYLVGDEGLIAAIPDPITFQPWEALELAMEAIEAALVGVDAPGKHYALAQLGRAREYLRAADVPEEEFTNGDGCSFG